MARAYHGTPITPETVLRELGARCFCVSYFNRQQIAVLATLAAILMIDNGAFSAWRKGIVLDRAYWLGFYAFVERWLAEADPRSWFVIPDVIDAGSQEQDALIRECPEGLRNRGAPVWHMDEPVARLLALIDAHPRVCIGSTAEYRVVGSPAWRLRMDEAWDAIVGTFGAVPETHMLRGLQCFLPTYDYPFASGDSTDLARNHNRLKWAARISGPPPAPGELMDLVESDGVWQRPRTPEEHLWAVRQRADRWDRWAGLNPTTWTPRGERQMVLALSA